MLKRAAPPGDLTFFRFCGHVTAGSQSKLHEAPNCKGLDLVMPKSSRTALPKQIEQT